jgi:hypothetical protein
MDLELAQLALRGTHRPHWLCKDLAGDVWEFISYPYIWGDRVAIKIRVPGDPTSIITADALALDPEGQQCMCSEAGRDFYLEPRYYRERSARLKTCPARLVPYTGGGEA